MRPRPTLLLALPLALVWVACAAPHPTSSTEVLVVSGERLPDGPDDPQWQRLPAHDAELLLQDMVEPRLLEPSTARLEVRAVTDGATVAFRLSWQDGTLNDRPGASRFSDAVAIQLPRDDAPDVPAPQMGEERRPVEIAYWRASWQASVDGRPDTIASLYPGATVDHYPFEAPSLEPGSEDQTALAREYAPARALGHAMEGPRQRPVQDLLAEGPGTLTPDSQQRSRGRGVRGEDGWSVVISRPLPIGWLSARGQIAFAVWDGENQEVGARKMRSGWIPLRLEGNR